MEIVYNENSKKKLSVSKFLLVLVLFLIPFVSASSTINDTIFFSTTSNSTILVNATFDNINHTDDWLEIHNISGTFAYFENRNSSFNGLLHIYNISSPVLIYMSNLSVPSGCQNTISCQANVNLTITPNNYTYFLDNFNLTEGISRQYSPLWFSQSTLSEKRIASNLTDTINATVVFDIDPQLGCSAISKIEVNGTTTGYYRNYGSISGTGFNCSLNTIQLSGMQIENSTQSTIITITYQSAPTSGSSGGGGGNSYQVTFQQSGAENNASSPSGSNLTSGNGQGNQNIIGSGKKITDFLVFNPNAKYWILGIVSFIAIVGFFILIIKEFRNK